LIEGSIEFAINYGKEGTELKEILSAKKQVIVSFSKDGIHQHGAWNDAV